MGCDWVEDQTTNKRRRLKRQKSNQNVNTTDTH